jgi:hypothetical protein
VPDLTSSLVEAVSVSDGWYDSMLKESCRREQRERIEIDVAIIGRLILEESIVYHFAHDEKGQSYGLACHAELTKLDYLLRD